MQRNFIIDQAQRPDVNRTSLNAVVQALIGLCGAVACVCAGCQAPKVSDDASAQAAIAQAVNEESKAVLQVELESYYRDLSSRKWSVFATHFWPGATITTIWRPSGEERERVHVQTVPEFIARTPDGADSKPIFSEKLLSAEIQVDGPLAHAWAHYEAEFGDPGNLARWKGTDAFTFMRFEGRWRIVALAFSPE